MIPRLVGSALLELVNILLVQLPEDVEILGVIADPHLGLVEGDAGVLEEEEVFGHLRLLPASVVHLPVHHGRRVRPVDVEHGLLSGAELDLLRSLGQDRREYR